MNKNNSHFIWVGIGIEINPKTDLHQECIKINKFLFDNRLSQFLFSGKETPHINLYDLNIEMPYLSNVEEEIKKLLINKKSFIVKIKSINYFSFGLFYIELDLNSELYNLHESIIKKISPYKGRINESYLEPYRSYNQKQKNLLCSYGNPYVLDQFNPHITLGHVKDKRIDLEILKIKLNMMLKSKEVRVDNINLVSGIKDYNLIGAFKLN